MKIAINAQNLTHRETHGISQYLFNLIEALQRVDSRHQYVLFSGKPLVHFPEGKQYVGQLVKPKRGVSYLGMPLAMRKESFDLAFVPRETVPFGLKVPTVITAFDLFASICSQEIKAEFSILSRMHYYLATQFHFKRADRILTISEDTKKDLIEHCGIPSEKIRVTPLGVDPLVFHKRPSDEMIPVLKKYGIVSPYFINTSSRWWSRKNLVRVIEAFALFRLNSQDAFQLIITGSKGPVFDKMRDTIAKHALGEHVKLLEYVKDGDLPYLLSGAIALVFPSLHEGFGLPILEAMACGCPVVTSNTSAIPEAAGKAALYVDPFDCGSIADGMKQIWENTVMREKFVIQGLERSRAFSWESTAKKTLQTFDELIG